MGRSKHIGHQAEALQVVADISGQLALALKAAADREGLGQFFTPPDLASLMAAEFDAAWAARSAVPLRLLDPGAGTGNLGMALIHRLLQLEVSRPIELVAVEVDSHLHAPLKASLEAAKKVLSEAGYSFSYTIVREDFLEAIDAKRLAGPFHGAILNPPYAKMLRNDPRLLGRDELVHGQPNIYAIFLAETLRLLEPGGRMVAVCPRSFASGPYFGRIRSFLRANGRLRTVTMFARRDELFARDSVLQETVVAAWDRDDSKDSAFALRVLEPRTFAEAFAAQLALPKDAEPWFLPNSKSELSAIELLGKWPSRLDTLGITVKTGPVVYFRTDRGRSHPTTKHDVPFIWMNNVQPEGRIEWPQDIAKRPQYFYGQGAQHLVVPNQWLVLVRRFSSRDDDRRLVAAVWNPEATQASYIAIENRVNVVSGESPFTEEQARLVAEHLSRPEIEAWFRARSGTTQVNAADLRAVPFEYTLTRRVPFWRWLANGLRGQLP